MQQDQLGSSGHVEEFRDLEQQRQKLRHRDGLGRLAVDRLADGTDRLRESRDIVLARYVAGLEMHLGDALIVAHYEAVEDLGQESPLFLAEPAGNAEIYGNDSAVGFDEQVARMHVGMEEAVAQRMPEKRLNEVAGNRLEVVASGGKASQIVHLDAVDPLHGDHIAAGPLPVDRGHAEAWIVSGVLAELGKCCRLQPHIHLDPGCLRQRLGQARLGAGGQ